MNQTEQKIIELGNQYIIYMLTINDEDKIIYSKLLELDDGGELEHFIFYKLRNYFWNDNPYIEKKNDEYDEDDEDDEDDDDDDDATRFVYSSTIEEFVGGEIDIFNNEEELIELKKKIGVWCEERNGSESDLDKYINVVEEYLYHYFSEDGHMSANEVKEYIINLLDPVEPK